MRVRSVPTRKQIERVADECNEEIIECLQSENAVNIIATIRFFGLGEKRIKRYLEFLADVKAEFRDYDRDGISTEKIIEELTANNIDYKEIYERPKNIRECLRQSRAEKKHKGVSIAEAYKMSSQIDSLKAWSENLNFKKGE